jgi:peptidyl-prolyl cis-trans isomerase A (cyclophilin A)
MNRPATRSVIAATVAVIAVIAVLSCQRSRAPEQTTTTDSAIARPTPDSFLVAFQTNKGRIVVQAVRAWAPRGVDRFYELVNDKFYDGVKFFRVLPNFMAQFGVSGDPAVNAAWKDRTIRDDSVAQSNLRGFVTFATGGPDTRTTQLFINKKDNKRLDAMGFAPFGRVVEGMDVVDSLYMGYGEGAPNGDGPIQDRIQGEGNRYLNRYFPKLDSVITARVVRTIPK